MKVWIVGQYVVVGPWEFQGVFASEEKAIAACVGPDYFVGPAELDKEIQGEARWWPGCFYPMSETSEQAAKRQQELGEPRRG